MHLGYPSAHYGAAHSQAQQGNYLPSDARVTPGKANGTRADYLSHLGYPSAHYGAAHSQAQQGNYLPSDAGTAVAQRLALN